VRQYELLEAFTLDSNTYGLSMMAVGLWVFATKIGRPFSMEEVVGSMESSKIAETRLKLWAAYEELDAIGVLRIPDLTASR
jgi:hypothetical protein